MAAGPCRVGVMLCVTALLPSASPAVGASSVAAALRHNVRTLSRPIYTYHYTTRVRLGLPEAGPIAPHHPIVQSYLKDRIGRFWDLGIPTAKYEVVGGLHVAIDPVISRVFGGVGDGWVLAQIVLPRGFRFLDVRTSGNPGPAPRFPPAIRSRLVTRGCDTDLPDYLLTTLESASCRQIAVETLVALDVEGILYDYPRIQFADCRERPGGAFIVLRKQALNMSEVKIFTKESSPDDAAADRLRIRQSFAEARRAGSVRPEPWPELGDATPPVSFGNWARDRLFGCGDYAEDPPLPGRGAEAVDYWKDLAQRATNSAWSHFNLAEALARQGEIANAIYEYRQALRLDPDFVEALQALAWTYATSEDPAYRDPDEAVRLATRLIELVYYRPRGLEDWSKHRKIEASMTLAVADAASGNLERAVAYAVQALEASSKEDSESGTPQTARTVAEARRLLELYRPQDPLSEKPK